MGKGSIITKEKALPSPLDTPWGNEREVTL
jgi:hypothetical protein